ncbi:MAG: hypothetical protein V7L29_29800 [Nostoc sp.]|uniref:hypothetical protein n=1 Tax=Nostoc sp. TaxID=1180 RepID=UPI002FF5A3AE
MHHSLKIKIRDLDHIESIVEQNITAVEAEKIVGGIGINKVLDNTGIILEDYQTGNDKSPAILSSQAILGSQAILNHATKPIPPLIIPPIMPSGTCAEYPDKVIE